MKIQPGDSTWPWMIEHTAYTLLSGKVFEDGKTALERYRGTQSHQSVVACGEQVMYKIMKTVKIFKDESRWEPGTWLGLNVETREHIIGTSRGVVKCRAIAAVEEDKKFNEAKLKEMKALPWQPVPRRRTNRIPTAIAAEGGEEEKVEDEDVEKFEVQVEQQAEDEDMPKKPQFSDKASGSRAMYVRQQDIKEHGPTKGCIGCRAIEGKRSYTPAHTHTCVDKELLRP